MVSKPNVATLPVRTPRQGMELGAGSLGGAHAGEVEARGLDLLSQLVVRMSN